MKRVASCVMLLLPAMSLMAPAQARPSAHAGDGDLGNALRRHAARTGRQIIFEPDLVRGRRVAPGAGVDAGLSRLLRGSGLRARMLGHGMILIEKAPLPAREDEPAGSRPARSAPAALPGEDIVVTALKRPSLLNQTPGFVRAVRGADLSARGIAGLEDLGRGLPGLAVIGTRTGEQRVAIRGIYGTGQPTVGIYYGETPVSGPAGTTFDPGGVTADVDLVDVDRLEVLHGPQGTLYGASSMGGTLRVLFNQPDSGGWSAAMTGGATVAQGGEPGHEASAMLNAPLVRERLAMRFVAYRRTSSPYVDKPLLGRRNGGAVARRGERISIGWTPGAGLRLTAMALSHRLSIDDGLSWNRAAGRYRNLDRTVTPYVSTLRLGSLTGDLDLRPGMRLTMTASHYRWRLLRQSDFSVVLASQQASVAGCGRFFALGPGTACDDGQMDAFGAFVRTRLPALLYQPMTVSSTSGEARLSSTGDGAVSWTVGLFFEDRRDATQSYTVRADGGSGHVLRPLDVTGLRTIDMTLRQRAIFGEADYRFRDGWTATLGYRRFDYRVAAAGAVPVPNVITGTAALGAGSGATREEGGSLKAGLSYRPGADMLVYAQAAQGFRPGGVNITPDLGEHERTYQADHLWSYEAGLKRRIRDRGSIQAAVFHIDWDDMIYYASSANGAFSYNVNVGRVRIDGIEVQGDYRLTDAIAVDARLGYVDARLAGRGLALAGGKAGDRLPDVAPLSWAVVATWRKSLPSGLAALARIGASGIGGADSKFNGAQPYDEHRPAHLLIDAGAQLGMGGWTLALSLDNLLDATGATRITSSAFSTGEVYGSRPRRLTMRVSRAF